MLSRPTLARVQSLGSGRYCILMVYDQDGPEAIEALKELPEDRQVTVARAILDYASHDDGS